MENVGDVFYMAHTVREAQGKIKRIGESQGILHSEVRENSEGQGKSGNLKVPRCKS